ncbi:MAG: hypothetical protein QG587_1643, partial [Chloroflexota bacterium]|nr:hypothetical protein [Chloroflexota bacterium]
YDGDVCLGGGRIDAPGAPAGPLAGSRDAVGALA